MSYRIYNRSYRSKNNPRVFGLLGSIFLILAIAFGIVSIITALDIQRFLDGTQTARGTIINCTLVYTNSSAGSHGNTSTSSCQPTVSFVTAGEHPVTFTSSFSSSSFHIGQQVEVRYHPGNPTDARIADFFALWFIPLLFLLFFVIWAIISAAMLLAYSVWRNRQRDTLLVDERYNNDVAE